jgi:hypothetical protein
MLYFLIVAISTSKFLDKGLKVENVIEFHLKSATLRCPHVLFLKIFYCPLLKTPFYYFLGLLPQLTVKKI